MSNVRALSGQTRAARASSPRDDFYTGISDINLEDALHSTQQLGNEDNERWPAHWQRYLDNDQGTEGSASMSIELGRGVKRAGEELNDDISSNAVFTFGNDSQYEITGTPPVKGALSRRKEDIRKDTSLRRANEGAKRTVSQSRKASGVRDLSHELEQTTEELNKLASNTKNTRFVKRTPPQDLIADTATSFGLPDVSNIGELINPTPHEPAARTLPRSKSTRFTHRADGIDRLPVRSVPIPEDEKKIYAALQTLQERFNQLEQENADLSSQLNACERENLALRNALAREEQLRRPDSALGEEDETAQHQWRLEKTKLQADLLTFKQTYEKAEQKLHASQAVAKACAKERDDLITQLGVECYRVQEAANVIDILRQEQKQLREELAALKNEIRGNRQTPYRTLERDLARYRSAREDLSSARTRSSTKFASSDLAINFAALNQEAREQIADAVRQQLRPQSVPSNEPVSSAKSTMFDLGPRARHQKPVVTSIESQQFPDEDAYTEFELTNTKNLTVPQQSQDDTANVTSLTTNDPLAVRNLRQVLEDERRNRHSKRHSSAPLIPTVQEPLVNNRRSSLRDVTQDIASKRPVRSVRVQSPSVEQPEGQSVEGETSAFIVPDITLHTKTSSNHVATAAAHGSSSCTMCNMEDISSIDIVPLVPISTRNDLGDDATVRPVQPPQDALALVMKQLYDELAHLKLTLAKYQKEHSINDPSTGARERKRLYDNIKQLMVECKRKEDQIYDLYDVLEGQVEEEIVSAEPENDKVPAKQFKSSMGYDGAYDSEAESAGLPAWEGLSEDGN